MQATRPPKKPPIKIKKHSQPIGKASFTKKTLKAGRLTSPKKDDK
jgi:hypothetical protein